MTAERWLRRFLLATAAAVYLGAAVELVLVEHYEDVWQIAPLVVVALGLLAIGWLWAAPSAGATRAVRWTAALAVVASLLGVYFHVEGNWAFVREVRPDRTGLALAWDALSGGNPLLAPGMVALAGILGAAATAREGSDAGA